MSHHTWASRSGWTIADRVATTVLIVVQCAVFVLVMFPSFDVALNIALGGALFVGSAVVAICGPVVIAATVALLLIAFYRDRVMFCVPLAGTLVMVALYVFPIILVTAMGS